MDLERPSPDERTPTVLSIGSTARRGQFSGLDGLFSIEVILIHSLLVVWRWAKGRITPLSRLLGKRGKWTCSAKLSSVRTRLPRKFVRQPRLWCWRSSPCDAFVRSVSPPERLASHQMISGTLFH